MNTNPPGASPVDLSLGPLPVPDISTDMGMLFGDRPAYSEELMHAERERCYALGAAAERERWLAALAPVLAADESELPKALYDLRGFIGPNVLVTGARA